MSMSANISHYASMSRYAVDQARDRLSHALDKMATLTRAGGFITDETHEAINLANDAAELRRLADQMMQVRAAFLANEPAQYREAAE